MKETKFTSMRRMSLKLCLLLFLIFSASISNAFAQATITGVVTDGQKEPLPGVSVIIKGSTTGTVTDFDGNYSIAAKSGDVLDFTYLGMKTQSIAVASQTKINVTLVDDSKVLTETVVIGYGTAKKADLTGSISSVSADAIMKQPALNAAQAIQGKMAGVSITGSDAPGSSPTVIIRGLGTALAGRDPLYIVDGFPAENIKNISPSDIVSMDVLKDASSASIYGVRAANGVIIVTTKKGQEGKTKIGVESYIGMKNVLNRVKMADASQYIQYFNENQQTLKTADPTHPEKYYFLADADKQAYNTDWYDEILGTGIFNNNTVSLSGGSKAVDYFFSYNFYDETGMLSGQDYQRTTIRNNNVFKFFNDRLKFKENLSISFANEGVVTYGPFDDAYRQSPLVPTRYADGTYGVPRANMQTGIVEKTSPPGVPTAELNSIGNPLFSRNKQNLTNHTLSIQGGIEGEFKITDYLTASSRFGATKYYTDNRNFVNVKEGWLFQNPNKTETDFNASKAAAPSNETFANNSLALTNLDTYRWTWEGFLTFNKSFDKHNVNVIAGLSREKQGIGGKTALKGYDVPAESNYWSMKHASNAYAKTIDQFSYTPRALASYFGRFQYNYDNKYYLTGTIRRDGSSTFKESKDYWGTFPSLGAGWTISKESFMESFTFLDYMKLRATWGKLGNQNVPPVVSSISTGSDVNDPKDYNYIFGPDYTYYIGAAFGSPAFPLSWEVTEEWGIGADFAFLHDRLTAGVDYYNKTNTNTILDVKPVSNSQFKGNYLAHGAEVNNKGIELNLGWKDRLANGFTYEISANYSHNTNKVVNVKPAYDGDTGGSLGNGQITKQLRENQPIYAWWMWETDGVWQNQAEINNPANAKYGSPAPGHLRYKDQNGDGVIDDKDKKYLGSYLPTVNYGIHIGLGYKQFDFSLDGYGVYGNKIYNALKGVRINGGENIAYDTYKDRWTGDGTSNTNPGANHDSNASSYYLESGSFFRINNLTLGYTLNNALFKGSNLRFYFTAQNPLIFTNYSGFSPELSGYSSDPNAANVGSPKETAGIETAAYPTTRNFIFGLNLSF